MEGPSLGRETMPSKALKLEALGPLALDIELVPVGLVGVSAGPQAGVETSGLPISDPCLGVSRLTGNPTSSARGI